MPVKQETFNNALYELLRTHGYDPIPIDSKGKSAPVAGEADIFKFVFTDGDVETDVWATVDNANELKLYFNDEAADIRNSENGYMSWTQLLKHLKSWAQRRQLGFELINRDNLAPDMAKREHMKKKEQLGEGYYPMGKKASYSDSVPQVKMIIQHTRQIEEGEQRFRNIAKIFVENVEGERFLLPTKRPGLARVFARHIAEGGTPYDERGAHITTLVEEYTKMAGFVRATKNGQFNESAQRLVNEGVNHYQSLRETLSRMTSHRGYNTYFESYTPVLNEQSDDEVSLNELFVQETLDPRIESVLPILNRLSRNITEMSEVAQLEEWADSITEGESLNEGWRDYYETWLMSDWAPEKKDDPDELQEKATFFIDDATLFKKSDEWIEDKALMFVEKWMDENYYDDDGGDWFDDDEEEDEEDFYEASEGDVEEGAELRYYYPSATKARIKDKVKKKFNRMEEGPADEPVEPDMDADDKRWDDAEDVAEGSTKDTMHHDAENMSLKEFLLKHGDDELAREFWHKVNGVDEGLDANQKRAGQLGPTEPVGKNEKNLRGKLVGASESRDFDDLKRLAGL